MDTSITLLQSIKSKGDRESWTLLNEIYSPMIRRWLQRAGIWPDDEDDVVQEVLLTVAGKIRNFEHRNQTGSFRSWLKQIAINAFRNFSRKNGNQRQAVGGSDIAQFIEQLADPNSVLGKKWNEEHQQAIFQYLLKVTEQSFSRKTWQAFYLTAIDSQPTQAVAAELDMSAAAIHTARARVLAEMRRLGNGLLEEEFI